MIHFIGGSEPYLVDCQKLKLVGTLDLPELNYMEAESFDERVVTFLSCVPVADTRKVAYITVDTLSACDTSLFHTFRDRCPKYAELIVRFRSHDGHTSFYKQLEKDGLLTLFDKESALNGLSEFVSKRAVKMGGTFLPGALEEFLRRENYSGKEEITIYNIVSDLKNLISLNPQISVDNVRSMISEHDKDNVFAIAKMIRNGDVAGLRKQAALLRGSEIGALSALLREYRLAYKASFYPLKDIGVNNIVFSGMDREQLCNGIDLIVDTIDALKRGGVPSSVALDSVFLQLCKKQTTV